MDLPTSSPQSLNQPHTINVPLQHPIKVDWHSLLGETKSRIIKSVPCSLAVRMRLSKVAFSRPGGGCCSHPPSLVNRTVCTGNFIISSEEWVTIGFIGTNLFSWVCEKLNLCSERSDDECNCSFLNRNCSRKFIPYCVNSSLFMWRKLWTAIIRLEPVYVCMTLAYVFRLCRGFTVNKNTLNNPSIDFCNLVYRACGTWRRTKVQNADVHSNCAVILQKRIFGTLY